MKDTTTIILWSEIAVVWREAIIEVPMKHIKANNQQKKKHKKNM